MLHRRLSVCLCGVSWAVAWAATVVTADDYVAQLKNQVPYYRTMTGKFAPLYEPFARQVVGDYHLRDGLALEIGSSCGAFSMELARQTRMTVYALDIDVPAIRLCGVLVDEAGLTGRVIPVEGDALRLPFRSNWFDFIFSRGSIPFWPDQVRGLKEAYRVLKPGGVAYIGGGFGRLLDPKIRQELVADRLARGKTPEGWHDISDLDQKARAAGLKDFRFTPEPQVGWWLEIHKPR